MRILDLFCGAGGASMGYYREFHNAEIIGVDINPQPNYPFQFQQCDAMLLLQCDPAFFRKFDLIHASPPCQASCTLTKGTHRDRDMGHINLIPEVRELLALTGVPTVLENVQGSDLRRDLTLCGEMFGLGVLRHRYFECSFPVEKPAHLPHRGRVQGWRHGEWFAGPYVAVYGHGGGKGSLAEWRTAMDINWMDRKELAEAIPPAYTEYVGHQFALSLELPLAA